ncbi:MAG TPA: T9SS type A sorting domain-containing protein, partial [Chitinophagales bacterium]|nr:T9SS type A sorting domain-containing protein [Chitinophagales bacterium]
RHSGSDTQYLEVIDAVPHIKPIALQLSPNPAQQYTTIQLGALPADKGVLQIRDMHGRILQQQKADTRLLHNIRLNTQQFAKGMYVIQFLGEKNTAIARLLVQ